MKVYVDPVPSNLSQAMHRVSRALRLYSPDGVTIVDKTAEADLQVLHTIGIEGMQRASTDVPQFAVIQYCLQSAGGSRLEWENIWRRARTVWSYYPLDVPDWVRFYHAPLGVNSSIFRLPQSGDRPIGAMSSGYVSGPDAEAIQEVADAAFLEGLSVTHLGPPNVVGMPRRRERTWVSRTCVADRDLACLYGKTKWVSGLRHTEGFELPVIEGAACGARPVVFDRPDMRQWYSGLAEFVPETNGPDLVANLRHLFSRDPQPVSESDRAALVERFNWQTITEGFWRELLR